MARSKKALKYDLIPKGRILSFDEDAHKYSDDINTPYTSTTTIISKYHEHFDDNKEAIAKACERIGKNPNHQDYLLYKNKSAKRLLLEWTLETERACKDGTKRHDYLEQAVKTASNYRNGGTNFINGRIYTIDDIIKGHNFGKLSLDHFVKIGVYNKYPKIYNLIAGLVKQGFRIYAEIGVYDVGFKISGLVDILLVRDNDFIILDWKTNKAPLHFDSGYYKKLPNGNLDLDRFIKQDKKLYYPLEHLDDSAGNHYTLQLSTYDYLVESFGFNCLGNILAHMRIIEGLMDGEGNPVEEVKFYNIEYRKEDVIKMLSHNIKDNINEDPKLGIW